MQIHYSGLGGVNLLFAFYTRFFIWFTWAKGLPGVVSLPSQGKDGMLLL